MIKFSVEFLLCILLVILACLSAIEGNLAPSGLITAKSELLVGTKIGQNTQTGPSYFHVDTSIDLHNVASQTLSDGSKQSLFEALHEISSIPIEDMEFLESSVITTTVTTKKDYLYDLKVDLRFTILPDLFPLTITNNHPAMLRQHLQSIFDKSLVGGEESPLNQILQKNAIIHGRHLMFGDVRRVVVTNSVKLIGDPHAPLPTPTVSQQMAVPMHEQLFQNNIKEFGIPKTVAPTREPTHEPTQEPTTHPTSSLVDAFCFDAYFRLTNNTCNALTVADQTAVLNSIVDVTDVLYSQLQYLGESNQVGSISNCATTVGVRFTIPVDEFAEFNGNQTKVYLYLTGLMTAAVQVEVMTTLVRKEAAKVSAHTLLCTVVNQVTYQTCASKQITRFPTVAPTKAPTAAPTVTSAPILTTAPTVTSAPTATTSAPTTAGGGGGGSSAAPTLDPTNHPGSSNTTTGIPTKAPTNAPLSLVPTFAPTAPVPTAAPTQQVQPIIIFNIWIIIISGSGDTTLSLQILQALLNAIAQIELTLLNNVQYMGLTSNSIVSPSTAALSQLSRQQKTQDVTELTEFILNYKLSFNAIDYPHMKNLTQLYWTKKDLLSQAYDEGELFDTFQLHANNMSPTTGQQVSNLNITDLKFSNFTVLYPSGSGTQSENPVSNSDEKNALTAAIIGAIVVGAVIGCGGLLLGCYFIYTRYLTPGGVKDRPDRDSNRVPIERMPSHDIPLDDIYDWDRDGHQNKSPDDMIVIDVAEDYDFHSTPRNSLFRNQILELSFISTTESRL